MSETVDPVVDPYAPVLPRAVREQIERANQLAREAGIANVPPAAAHAAEGSPEGGGPEGSPGTASETSSPGAAPAGSSSEVPIPSEQPELPLETPTQPAPAVDWEQRYSSLQGKYNSETTEMRAQLAALREVVNTLSSSGQGGSRADLPAALPASALSPRSGPAWTPSAADVDAYGHDLIMASQRWAEAKYAPILEAYEQRLARVETNAQQLGQLSLTQRVEASLDATIPDWKRINDDPRWDAWLDQVDVFSNRTRKDMITEAYQRGDAPRTIAFFHAFQREQTATTPASMGIQPSQTGSGAMPVGPAAPLPLEILAAPGRGPVAIDPASGAPAGNGRRIWSGADIAAFNEQKRRGLWRGRENEMLAIERDFMAAQYEGRFRQ